MLAGVDASIGPIWVHGAVARMNTAYEATGIALPETRPVSAAPPKNDWAGALIVAPPSAHNTPWSRKFNASTGFASGWMRVRGARRRRAVDRGFVLSDHADWPGLVEAVRATGAEQIYVTHGSTQVFVAWLREQGLDAHGLQTLFEGERDDVDVQEVEAPTDAE
jgi:putative mRNA 3-end processing factor